MSLPKAVLYLQLPGDAIERISAVADVVNVAGRSRQDLLAALADAEGLLCSNMNPVDAELFTAAPRMWQLMRSALERLKSLRPTQRNRRTGLRKFPPSGQDRHRFPTVILQKCWNPSNMQ